MDANTLDIRFRAASKVALAIFIIGFSVSTFLFFRGLWEASAFQREFCTTKNCISNFLNFVEFSISSMEGTISLTITSFTLLGIYFAVLNYISTAKTNAISNHLLNLNTFKDFLNDEIARKGRINKESIDTFRWYNLIFPDSKKGLLTTGDQYKNLLNKIDSCIAKSNEECLQSGTPSFEYKPHQRRMRDSLQEIGVRIELMPRNDFKEAEKEILELINTTNKEFCGGDSLKKLTEPAYF